MTSKSFILIFNGNFESKIWNFTERFQIRSLENVGSEHRVIYPKNKKKPDRMEL